MSRRSKLRNGTCACLCLGLCLVSLSLAQIQICGWSVSVRQFDGIAHVPLAELVQACGGRQWRVLEQSGTARFVAVIGGKDSTDVRATTEREFVFWADRAAMRTSEKEIILPAATRLEHGQLYVPVLALAAILPEFSPSLPVLTLAGVFCIRDTAVVKLGLRQTERQQNSAFKTGDSGIVKKKPKIKPEVPVWHGETKSSLEYQLAVGASCDSQASEQLGLIPMLTANGLVQSVRAENAAGATVVFTFRKPAAVRVTADTSGITLKAWPKPARKVRTVVLDPGHGGADPGAVSNSGTQEKTIVLDIALRLKPKLEAAGLEVILTRDKDELVTLSDRSKLANSKKADLFVSIHANASTNRQACGLETYFLSESKTDWERTVAARENAALEFELPDSTAMTDELQLILTDLAQNEFLYESSEMAARIQEQTLPLARIANRGVRQANFFVLRNNYMPAVLVECGFLTNRSEEKLLKDPVHRERLAEGICQGILEFIRQYEKRVNGS